MTMVVIACIALLGIAAWRDVAVRTIPDMISVGLLVVGLVRRAALGPNALVLSVAVALALFLLLVLLHARRLLGGGDVKLAAALAVGLAPAETYDFVVFTALAGGFLAIIYLAMSRLLSVPTVCRPSALFVRVYGVEAWRIRRRKSLPYGVAIALGGASVLLRSL